MIDSRNERQMLASRKEAGLISIPELERVS
jgi:hypothetical protein